MEALAGAAAALRAELASAALPPGKAASAQVPSPLLVHALVSAARALLSVASLSAARAQRLAADIPSGAALLVRAPSDIDPGFRH